MNELFKYNSSKQEYLLNAINEYLEMEEFDSAIEFIIRYKIMHSGSLWETLKEQPMIIVV